MLISCLAFSVISIVFLSIILLIAASDPRVIRSPLLTLVNDLAINSSRSFTVTPCDSNNICYSLLVLTLNHSAHSSASAVNMTCTESPDSGTTTATLQDIAVSSGVGTSSNASWVKAVTGTAVWPWRVDVHGFMSVTCTITGTGADGSDKITVKGYMVSE